MYCALVRPDPAKLAVAGNVAPEPAGIFPDPIEVEPDDERLQGLDRGNADLVAPPIVKVSPCPSIPGSSVSRIT